VTQHRNLNYGDRFPEAVSDALQEFISTLLVNLRLTKLNPTTLRIAAATGNDQVGAGIMGRWRYVTANVDAAHPGGAAGTYDVYLTASDNVFTPSGNPPGQTPEIDNTVYAFSMTIRPAGSPPATALYRRIAQVVWDGSAITRVLMVAGGSAMVPDDVIVTAPENGTRNTVRSSGDFVPLRIQQHLAADGSDLLDVLDDAGNTICRITHDGLIVQNDLTTAERDALPPSRRPVGGIFYNADTGRHETNIGTETAPIWTGVGGYGAGVGLDFFGPETQIPPRTALCDGRYFDKVVEPGLWRVLSDGGGGINPWDTFGGLPAPPAGMYRVPDLRGRGTVGKKNMGLGNATTPTLTGVAISRALAGTLGSLLGEEYHTLTAAEIPNVTGTTSVESAQHYHTGNTTSDTPAHQHSIADPGHVHAGSYYMDYAPGGTGGPGPGPGNDAMAPIARTTTGITVGNPISFHSHAFTSGYENTSHTHTFSLNTGGGSHENVFPVAVVNKLVTL
jgi:hypothetical protein